MSTIINSSFEQGVFPDLLKIAKVIPVYKNGPKDSISNYRPILILPFFSKIFEKAMYNRSNSYIAKSQILILINMGIVKIILSIIDMCNNIMKSPDDRKAVIGTCID